VASACFNTKAHAPALSIPTAIMLLFAVGIVFYPAKNNQKIVLDNPISLCYNKKVGGESSA